MANNSLITYGEIIQVSSYEELRCTIDEFERNETKKFNVINETKDFKQDITLKQYVDSNTKFQICWESHREGDSLPFEYTGTPFIVAGKRSYQCHQGKDINASKKQKRKQKILKDIIQDHDFNKTRKLTQPSKKNGCPVVFNVKKVFQFPEFSIPKDTRKNRDNAAKKVKDYANSLSSNEAVPSSVVLLCR